MSFNPKPKCTNCGGPVRESWHKLCSDCFRESKQWDGGGESRWGKSGF